NGGALVPLDATDHETVREARARKGAASLRAAETATKTRQNAEAVCMIVRDSPGIGTRGLLAKSTLGPPVLDRALELLKDEKRIVDRAEQHGKRTDHHYF